MRFARISDRTLSRNLRRLGIKFNELEGVKRVIIETESKRYILEDPTVQIMSMKQGQIYQVLPKAVKEESLVEEPIEISDEDIELVASQAGCSREEAKAALVKTKGDLAEAIILLKEGEE